MPDERPLVLLMTTFPVATETFLQREVTTLRDLGYPVEVRSLWQGADTWQGRPVVRLGWQGIVRSFAEAAYWALKKPQALRRVLNTVLDARFGNIVNGLETWLGLGAGLRWARAMTKSPPQALHAVWASAPATAAWVIHELTGLPYSFSGHAYDLFEDGGDALLAEKIRTATWIRSSTSQGCQEFTQRGALPHKTHVIRRGLPSLPGYFQYNQPQSTLRIISVGRLVEKMGYPLQLEAYALLKAKGVAFQVDILGAGPVRPALERRIQQLNLGKQITLHGKKTYSEVEAMYRKAHVAVFSGVVAKSGDRAGLPNTVAEAMAWGLPVVATPVGAVTEAIEDGVTGFIAQGSEQIAAALQRLSHDPDLATKLSQAGRAWAETHYDARRNMTAFAALLTDKPSEALPHPGP